MKKTVQINIGHQLFTIDEDAYMKLSQYLASLKNYFGESPESEEIISDIEYRIADLLSDRDVPSMSVSIEDVDSIIATMGTPREIDNEEILTDENAEPGVYPSEKKLVRIADGRILGGVCNGLADFFNIDVRIVRIIFILLGIGSFGTWSLVYLALWIILPAGEKQPWNAPRKKLYRDPQNKVLGGVLSGIAQYFGYSVNNVRLAFSIPYILLGISLLTGPFGFIFSVGFIWPVVLTMTIIYIILWIALPEASTVVDRMDMKGEPININTIKNSVYEGGAAITSRARNMGREVRDAYHTQSQRVNHGGILRAIGIVLKVSLMLFIFLVALGLIAGFIGLYSAGINFSTIDDFLFRTGWQEWGTKCILLIFIISPILTLVYILSRNSQPKNSKLAYLIAGLWVAAFLGVFALASSFAMDFRMQVSKKSQMEFPSTMDTLYIGYSDSKEGYVVDYSMGLENLFYENAGVLNVYNWSKMRINESPDERIHIYLRETCQGRNKEECQARLDNMSFEVNKINDSLIIDRYLRIHKPEVYRGQRATLVIEVPKSVHVIYSREKSSFRFNNRNGSVHISLSDEDEDGTNTADIEIDDDIQVHVTEDSDTTFSVDLDDEDFE